MRKDLALKCRKYKYTIFDTRIFRLRPYNMQYFKLIEIKQRVLVGIAIRIHDINHNLNFRIKLQSSSSRESGSISNV
jgi:hypothetical protein